MTAHDELPSVSWAKEALKPVLQWHTAAAERTRRPLAKTCIGEFKKKNGPKFLTYWTRENGTRRNSISNAWLNVIA